MELSEDIRGKLLMVMTEDSGGIDGPCSFSFVPQDDFEVIVTCYGDSYTRFKTSNSGKRLTATVVKNKGIKAVYICE